MAKKYEKTQRSNPHQLTIRQHCFPKKSIERFANKDGLVHVCLIEQKRKVHLKPVDYNFCALRTWDQWAENGYMKEIEDKFQDLADKIVDGKIHRRLNPNEKAIITDMYFLWICRWHWNKNPVKDQKIKSASGIRVEGVSVEYTKDDQEFLEKEGITAIKPNLSISGRHITGVMILQDIFDLRKHMHDLSWGILNSPGTEFVVPDNPSGQIMLPVSPSICLINREGYQFASGWKVAAIIDRAKNTSEKYYFARSL